MSVYAAVVLTECYYREKEGQTAALMIHGKHFQIKEKKVFPFFLPCRRLTLAFLTIASITRVKPFQQATLVLQAAK